jgi:uncharacterized membrane protein
LAKDNRLVSIDALRGLVMALMALDHVRDMVTTPLASGLDFSAARPALFFTRWITHICAPVFFLLAGISSSLYEAGGNSKGDLTRFLIIRGAWLILIELTVVRFAWNFNWTALPILQVIWALGWSMIALAGLLWLPRAAIAALGIALVLGHNALDEQQSTSPLWLILHTPGLLMKDGAPVAFVLYPLIPWIGVMALGYASGPYFAQSNPTRPARLIQLGVLLTAGFLILRSLNLYGEPLAWSIRSDPAATLIEFFNLTKYPPSLQFLLMTLGTALILLGWSERAAGAAARMLAVFGRVPFFYYIVHLYLIHAVSVLIGLTQGFDLNQMTVPFTQTPPGFGLSLAGAYVVWALILAALYPLCVWFAHWKAGHRAWWTGYL